METQNVVEKYFSCSIAVIERKPGETKEDAWSRHLLAHPEDACAAIKVFHRDSKVRVYTVPNR
jgi:hypothetical protein